MKNLVQEFCNKSLDKRQGSSDWNKDINELSDKQLEYAANDVIYLHKIKNELEKMLLREKNGFIQAVSNFRYESRVRSRRL